MKSIYINGRFLSQSITGVQRYALELIKAIDLVIDVDKQLQKSFSFELLVPSEIRYEPELKHIKIRKVGKLKGHLWEQLELPFFARMGLLVNLCNTAPILKKIQTVTIHDAAVFANPSQYTLTFRLWYRFLYRVLGIKNGKIITVSNFSKNELQKYSKIRAENLKVIYEGKEHILNISEEDSILQKYGLKKNRYVLAVSSNSPNKNFHAIVKAISLLEPMDYDIVIAGGSSSKIYAQNKIPVSDRVKLVGYVSDQELKALYQNAGCFVYPSFYEGFGLPPLEAMTCGCPVIVSNAGSLPEIFEEAALYCNPDSVTDVAEKIALVMQDTDLQNQLRQKGMHHVKKFQWDQSASQSLLVFKEALK
ncbi:glycosyltransferase family 4 protein [Paenibacillus beijingensis]|uniref:Glycosyl transferase family 1 domain-containing protein n=1 Tax=Paenibacillus beijingensis TaxID=1126833 RepID=A0A0D5NFP7_9BACL|nr:glycosyltransferase family 1 protein [Paenibacillus beijingensis]AJY73975.1 hypothetical protein VN24_04285 [Paenibacillus beijingensis]